MKLRLNHCLLYVLFLLISVDTKAQNFENERTSFSHADSVRGTYGSSRDWWDVLKYDLHVNFDSNEKTVTGQNIIQIKAIKAGKILQVDLQEPMKLDSVFIRSNVQFPNSKFGTTTKFKLNNKNITKDGNAYFLYLDDTLQVGNIHYLFVYYHGAPREGTNPPWDGGLVWSKDKNKNPWISIACQELGASVWYPCKDHQQDEPDSAAIHITVPDSLIAISNGRLREKINNGNGTTTYHWAVINPINNYNIIPYIGKYVHFDEGDEKFVGEEGVLDMDYWVLDYNLEKAKVHFKDAVRTLKAFEYWFGPYPFYKDGYKLVEAPYLGMEHQSAVAYGNEYQKGYKGYDLSSSGWGLKWDYLIVHETGHEWFGNNITTKDIADMWVHESFTCYSETLFTEYYYGKEAGNKYVQGLRLNIENDRPLISYYNVNKAGSADIYYKGANMIHTIRQVINNDSLFRNILRGLNKTFYHSTVTTQEIEQYISSQSGINFSNVFNQYLRTIEIPILEYKIKKNTVSFRYTNCIPTFNLPLKTTSKKEQWIYPSTKWKTVKVSPSENNIFSIDPNFYIKTKKVD